MKNILCFGDSNTHGYNPENGHRFSFDIRWTGRLQILLGDKYRIIEEGYNGRTTLTDDFTNPSKTSRNYLLPCLASHSPLDLIIIMLGTNDLKNRFNLTSSNIAKSMKEIVRLIKTFDFECDYYKTPEILLVSPIEIDKEILKRDGDAFDAGSIKKLSELPKLYEDLAKSTGCHFLDAAKFAKPSKADLLHMDAEAHRKFADAVYAKVKEILD
ncbi:MAG: SGNH/GDSL hydrolase family protein [Elusimicrobiota bacterium]|nr:SGNH/GDSL hydrolase family protein [Elusimicrobiota bacterium]